MEHLIGRELGVSDWTQITQDMLDTHAATTGDADWIHNDPERAKREAPFGGTIAQGFLLLSNLSRFQQGIAPLADNILYALNYGFDRVRFVQPVPVDARISRIAADALPTTPAANTPTTMAANSFRI